MTLRQCTLSLRPTCSRVAGGRWHRGGRRARACEHHAPECAGGRANIGGGVRCEANWGAEGRRQRRGGDLGVRDCVTGGGRSGGGGSSGAQARRSSSLLFPVAWHMCMCMRCPVGWHLPPCCDAQWGQKAPLCAQGTAEGPGGMPRQEFRDYYHS